MIVLDGSSLDLPALVAVARGRSPVALGAEARAEMARSRAWVEGTHGAVYGVNTGFGSLARVHVEDSQLGQLQRNLVRSHAAGVGDPVPVDAARAMVLLRANALARGRSGCRPELVELLVELLNRGVDPVVPSQGSCGSSGDLAPLAHLALLMSFRPEDPDLETGEAWVDGERLSGRAALAKVGLAPVVLGRKEGLALTNGAQLSTAIAALALYDAGRLVALAEIAAAMSIEALKGVRRAFHPLVHENRPYTGARASAARLLALLDGSGWVDPGGKVQDAYALRCSPVVLGAVRDTLAFASSQVGVELNSVTDNPLILVDAPGEDKAFSAGLFHGEPVGIAADCARIAVAELASLSERRLYRLTTGKLSAALPASLRQGPGVGLLALQTTAAALVSENKARSWPSSVDSIPTCEDQEDHVAMSTTAARRLAEVVVNARRVVAIELVCARRALEHRVREDAGRPLGKGTSAAFAVLAGLEGTPSEMVAQVEQRLDAVLEACP